MNKITVQKYTSSLDQLHTDLIVTTMFEGEKPPRSLMGFMDWRLHGFLSRQIKNGFFSGQEMESILIPLHDKMPARRLLVLGLGKKENYTLGTIKRATEKLARIFSDLNIQDTAIRLPNLEREQNKGETEGYIFGSLKSSNAPDGLLVWWLDLKAFDC